MELNRRRFIQSLLATLASLVVIPKMQIDGTEQPSIQSVIEDAALDAPITPEYPVMTLVIDGVDVPVKNVYLDVIYPDENCFTLSSVPIISRSETVGVTLSFTAYGFNKVLDNLVMKRKNVNISFSVCGMCYKMSGIMHELNVNTDAYGRIEQFSVFSINGDVTRTI